MKKLPDWEIEFDTVVNRNLYTPFKWGEWDCVHLTNTFIKAMTGESLLPSNWKWQTKEQAMQSIFKYGKGKGLVAAIDNAIELKDGIDAIDIQYMSKGDFGVHKEETELAFVFDGYASLGVDADGLVIDDDVDILKVWRING
tara:strand:- start:1913 stop:2338 length:426 start_codon:yes stop_codon:yes gene_type:complete